MVRRDVRRQLIIGSPAACDLFTVEVLTLAGLKRYLVFFVIELETRRVTIAGIHRSRTARGWSNWPAI